MKYLEALAEGSTFLTVIMAMIIFTFCGIAAFVLYLLIR